MIWAMTGLLAAAITPAWASGPNAEQLAARAASVAKENTSLQQLDRRPGSDHSRLGASADAVTATGDPSPPFANGYRAYPPSCLADPLPFDFQGPRYQRTVNLATYRSADGAFSTENVTISVWRVPCSGPGNVSPNSATLIGIDRSTATEGTDPYTLFPAVRLTQGNNSLKLVRIAAEPNTVLAHISQDTPVIFSQTFVLENFASNATSTALWDFNKAFTITFYNGYSSDTGQSLAIPAYVPTQADYPNAYKPLPITGYLTGNWYDPNKGGEGMTVQVFELPGDTTNYLFTFALFTYDPTGLPYWLFGGTTVPAGARGSLTVPTTYSPGGTFLGGATNPNGAQTWGTVTFNFHDCGLVNLSFNKTTTSTVAPGVTGQTVQRGWTRLIGNNVLSTNGISCE
jgi:hypothetical protein